MKTRNMLLGMIGMLLMIGLACNATLRQPDAAPTDAGAALSERAENVAAQAAAAATAAANTIATVQVPTVSLPADSSAAATTAAQSLNDLQQDPTLAETAAAAATSVANAAGTLTLPALNGASLAERFAALSFDNNGSYTITVTEADLNQAIQAGQNTDVPAGNEATIEQTAVQFSDGIILLSGTITNPNLGNMVVQLRPVVIDGTLQFEVISATVGNVNVPTPLLQTAAGTLNSTLGTALNNLPAGVSLQTVTVSDGVMTLVLIKA